MIPTIGLFLTVLLNSSRFVFQGGIGWDNKNQLPNVSKTKPSQALLYCPTLKLFLEIEGSSFPFHCYRSSIIHRKKNDTLVVFGGNKTPSGTHSFGFEPMKSLYVHKIGSKKNWKEIVVKPKLPYEVAFHTALYHDKTDQMYIFGGRKFDVRKKSIIIFDFGTLSWKKFKPENFPLKGLAGHSMDWWIEKGNLKEKIIILGGADRDLDGCTSKVFEFNVFRKKMVEYKCVGEIPHPRSSHSTCIYKNHLYVFGGTYIEKSQQYSSYNDFFRLDLFRKCWQKIQLIGDIPPPMYLQKSGLFFKNNVVKMFIFGGVVLKSGSIFGGFYVDEHVYEIEIAKENGVCDIKELKKNLLYCKSFIDLYIYFD